MKKAIFNLCSLDLIVRLWWVKRRIRKRAT
jgi:hypothetical protein